MTTKEVEKKLQEAAEQVGKHIEKTRDVRLARVFERIEKENKGKARRRIYGKKK